MATLHIEHPIKDFLTWKAAFDRFADNRKQAGVAVERIQQPHDDPNYILVQLDFPSVEQAMKFQTFLETRVWNAPANSPGLAGSPKARVLIDAPGD